MIVENSDDNLNLLTEIRALILDARQKVAIAVNSQLTLLYWQIGDKLHNQILGAERATYGKQVVKSLSKQLVQEFGEGFSEKALRHCLRFAQTLPDFQIVSTLSRQLSWSHFLEVENNVLNLMRNFVSWHLSLNKMN